MRSIGPGVDGVEAFDELAGVTVRIGARDVEQRLGDRQRGPQLVRGVRREPLLFGVVGLELREHRVEGVGELAELIAAAREPDPVGQRSIRGDAGGGRDARQWSEHPAGQEPPSDETDHQQGHQHEDRGGSERSQEVGTVGHEPGADDRAVGDVAQEEHPHGRKQQGARDHQEAGVAERELEANARTGGSTHGLLPRARPRTACRCGTRRRARWR